MEVDEQVASSSAGHRACPPPSVFSTRFLAVNDEAGEVDGK